MLRRFIDYYKPHRKLFFADLFFAFLLAVCDLFYPMIAKNIINEYVPDKNLRLLLIWSAVLLGIYLLKAGFNYFVNYYGHIVGVRMQADMRRDVFRRLQKLPFSFYDENKTGSIMSRIINDLMDISELAHHGPEDLFLSLVMLVASFAILCTVYGCTLLAGAGRGRAVFLSRSDRRRGVCSLSAVCEFFSKPHQAFCSLF